MSANIPIASWKYLSEAIHDLLQKQIEELVKPQIKIQHERVHMFHLERDIRDPLEIHDMNYLEPSKDKKNPNDTASFLSDTVSNPGVYGFFEFLSDIRLERFTLGDNPPTITVLQVEEFVKPNSKPKSNNPIYRYTPISSVVNSNKDTLMKEYYRDKEHEETIKRAKISMQNQAPKTVIGSSKLPSRMNGVKIDDVDYSTLERFPANNRLRNFPPEIRDVLNSIGEGVSCRIAIDFDSTAEIHLETTISINEPFLKFIEIPIAIRLKNVKIAAEVFLTYETSRDTLHLYLERSSTLTGKLFENTPIRDFSLTVDVGDPSLGPVLRDTSKINGFILEALKEITSTKVIYPFQIDVKHFLWNILKETHGNDLENDTWSQSDLSSLL